MNFVVLPVGVSSKLSIFVNVVGHILPILVELFGELVRFHQNGLDLSVSFVLIPPSPVTVTCPKCRDLSQMSLVPNVTCPKHHLSQMSPAFGLGKHNDTVGTGRDVNIETIFLRPGQQWALVGSRIIEIGLPVLETLS